MSAPDIPIKSPIRIGYRDHPISIMARIRKTGDDLLFFIHGLGCDGDFFAEAFRFPGLVRYSAITFDLPGFGESDCPAGFGFRMEEHAEICRLLLEDFPVRKVHIIAHSMGGAIGLFLAERLTDRVATFISIEGNLGPEDCTESRNAVEWSGMADDFLSDLRGRLLGSGEGRSRRANRLWADSIARASPRAFRLSSESLVRWSDGGELLRKFRALVCHRAYIYGERNQLPATLAGEERIVVIRVPLAGHFPMIDNPEFFYDILNDLVENEG